METSLLLGGTEGEILTPVPCGEHRCFPHEGWTAFFRGPATPTADKRALFGCALHLLLKGRVRVVDSKGKGRYLQKRSRRVLTQDPTFPERSSRSSAVRVGQQHLSWGSGPSSPVGLPEPETGSTPVLPFLASHQVALSKGCIPNGEPSPGGPGHAAIPVPPCRAALLGMSFRSCI